MTRTQRLLAVVIAGAMLVGGFAFGRMAETPKTNAEEGKTALVNSTAPEAAPQAASENQAFFLSDYKTGYDEGYNAGMNGIASGVNNTTRAGFNEGFKEGYADGYQAKANQQTLSGSPRPVATGNRFAQQQLVSRPAARRSGPSKLNTALTIAAPAAIGAGIGVAAGGKKGAAVGALVGGGGGALYHLIKNRDRN
ncbi:MAG: hypothetical protein ACRD9Y_14265 [Blastocatellia bacterium]